MYTLPPRLHVFPKHVILQPKYNKYSNLRIANSSAIIGAFFLVPNHFLDFGQSLGAQGLFLTNYMFWREAGYFDNPTQFKPLLHTWSLSVEEQFYVIIPIVFFGIKNLTRKKINMIIVFLLLISFLFSIYYLGKNQNSVFYFLPFRAWELLLG